MDRTWDEEEIPPGPGLPAFVHRVPAVSWLFIAVGAAVGVARVDSLGLFDFGHEWSLTDAAGLLWAAGGVLLVLAPVVLLQRRPMALRGDGLLALAAIVVALGPVVDVGTRVVRDATYGWLVGDAFSDLGPGSRWDWIQWLLSVPGWLVAAATPVLLVRAFGRLAIGPEARFPRDRVLFVVAGATLVAAILSGAAFAIASARGFATIGWSGLFVQGAMLAILALWVWAGLAALAGVRAGLGRWWNALLASAIVGPLASAFAVALMNLLLFATIGPDGSGLSPLVLWIPSVLLAAGDVALVVAFAVVPRVPATEAPPAVAVPSGP